MEKTYFSVLGSSSMPMPIVMSSAGVGQEQLSPRAARIQHTSYATLNRKNEKEGAPSIARSLLLNGVRYRPAYSLLTPK
ncbi:hypothetical protein V5799_029562 [Amblyomma americanum]|uniref:Uncharacterized protein n=1 Tax=Amblyomma americanum TaxID=6943 RepID=A0AAQ4EQR1_AMBAM